MDRLPRNDISTNGCLIIGIYSRPKEKGKEK